MANTQKTAKPKAATKAKGVAGGKAAKAPPTSSAAKNDKAKGEKAGGDKNAASKEPKRKLGLRGAAPWAARHAAKHAAEARARAAEPPLPGSARATIRIPEGADNIKARIGELHNAVSQVKGLRKNLAKNFFEIGSILHEIRKARLYEAKGYGTFDAFVDRETELGKLTGIRLEKVAGIFQRSAADDFGMDRLFTALSALENSDPSSTGGMRADTSPPSAGKVPAAPLSSSALPLKPPGR